MSGHPAHALDHAGARLGLHVAGQECPDVGNSLLGNAVRDTLSYINSTEAMDYGGEMSCPSNYGGKQKLDIAAQVPGHGPNGSFIYYTMTGSTLSAGPSPSPYLELENRADRLHRPSVPRDGERHGDEAGENDDSDGLQPHRRSIGD